jgi:hypothetical protein
MATERLPWPVSISQGPMEKRDISYFTSKRSLFRHETKLVTQSFIMKKDTALKLTKLRGLRLRERTIPTERPPFVGGHHDGSLQPHSRFSIPNPLLFLSNSSSIVLKRLSGPRSRPTTSRKKNRDGQDTALSSTYREQVYTYLLTGRVRPVSPAAINSLPLASCTLRLPLYLQMTSPPS